MKLLGILLVLGAAPTGPSPGLRVGPTASLLGSIGGGDAGVGVSIGAKGGARFVFSDNFGAAGTVGYEREFDGGARHLLSLSARGELLDAPRVELLFVKWALYVQLGALMSINDNAQPRLGAGLRAGVGFMAPDSKFPLVIEVNFQRQWVQSGPISGARLFLGVGF